mgnify:CR=1 FL=1
MAIPLLGYRLSGDAALFYQVLECLAEVYFLDKVFIKKSSKRAKTYFMCSFLFFITCSLAYFDDGEDG